MMEQKILKLFIEHARGFLAALEELTETATEPKAVAEARQEQVRKDPPAEKKDEPETNDVPRGGIPTKEELEVMTFNDLRSLGSKLGAKVGGRRSEIEANILALAAGGHEKAEKPIEEPAPKKEGSKNEPAEDPEEKADEDEIREACEEMTDEEIQEILKSVGLRINGKRTALIDRIIKAVADGVLDWSDDEESDEEGEEHDEGVNYGEFPELAVNDPEQCEITKERLEKLEELDALFESDEEGEGEEVIDEFLVGHFGSKFKVKKFGLRQKTLMYYEVMKLFVDDEGDEHSEKEGYYLNGELYCCAKPVDKDGKCLVCNDVYEIDDEE